MTESENRYCGSDSQEPGGSCENGLPLSQDPALEASPSEQELLRGIISCRKKLDSTPGKRSLARKVSL